MGDEVKTADQRMDDLMDIMTDISGRLDVVEKPKDPPPDPVDDPPADETIPAWAVAMQADLDNIKGREDVKEERNTQRKARRGAFRTATQKRKTSKAEASKIKKEKNRGTRIFNRGD